MIGERAAVADFVVRRAGLADAAGLIPLFEAFYREEGFAHAVGRIARTLPQVLVRSDAAAFVAEAAGGPAVGAATMSTTYGLEGGFYAELQDLYVTPAWRKRGVASGLVEACVVWARERGCESVDLVMTPEAQANPDLVRWYAARGFVSTGRVILERRLLPDRDNAERPERAGQ